MREVSYFIVFILFYAKIIGKGFINGSDFYIHYALVAKRLGLVVMWLCAGLVVCGVNFRTSGSGYILDISNFDDRCVTGPLTRLLHTEVLLAPNHRPTLLCQGDDRGIRVVRSVGECEQ